MNALTRLVVAPTVGVAAAVFLGLGAATASAEPPPPPPIPGSPDAPTHGSLVDQPINSGDVGWGYVPQGVGPQCENAWVVCGSDENAAASDLSPGSNDAGGWVSAPDETGAECDNPGVNCSDVG